MSHANTGHASAGVDWCGYRTWSTHILPRKRNIKRFRARLRQLQARYARGEATLQEVKDQVSALLAYTQYCSAARTTQSILNEITLTRGDHHARTDDHQHA